MQSLLLPQLLLLHRQPARSDLLLQQSLRLLLPPRHPLHLWQYLQQLGLLLAAHPQRFALRLRWRC